jgi:cytochrome o ubiquinol oxidase subunit IV
MSHHENEATDVEFGSDHGSIKSYIVGFILSIILTVVPFVFVAMHMSTTAGRNTAIAICALIQLFIQIVFFLHLDPRSKANWNLNVFIFTLMVVLILVFGSIWIMWSLNYYMVN